MMPVMRVHVRLTMVMSVIFVMVDVVLHMREARVVLCMLMLMVVHMLANLVSVARVAMIMPRVWKMHSVVAVHSVDRSI